MFFENLLNIVISLLNVCWYYKGKKKVDGLNFCFLIARNPSVRFMIYHLGVDMVWFGLENQTKP